MMSESGKREIELMRQLRKSTSVQEILEKAKALNWDFSEEEARDYLKLITRNDPEKGFCELLREALATDDLAKKEELFAKIEEQERNRVKQELFDRWSDTVDREEYIQLTMQLFPKVSKARAEAMADELNL